MAKKARNRAADYASFLAVRSLVCVVQMVSPRLAYAVADFLGWAVYALVKSRRQIALENARAAFPELAADPGATDRLVRAMFRHLLRVLVELILLPRKFHLTNWRKHIVLPDTARTLLPAMLSNRAALVVTAHFGNWEMAGFALGLFGFRT